MGFNLGGKEVTFPNWEKGYFIKDVKEFIRLTNEDIENPNLNWLSFKRRFNKRAGKELAE